MLSILPWALMALAPLAEARFGIRPGSHNNETIRCCPCISTSLGPHDATVTVTVTSPKETVTIDHTIVLPATTVFVTHNLAPGSPATVTHKVTAHPESPAKVETAVDVVSSSESSAQNEPIKTVTMMIPAGGDQPESPKTVTVTLKPDEPNPVQTRPNSAVTVTITQQTPDSQPSAEPSHLDNGQGAGANTVTVAAAPASHSSESKPSIKTVTFVQKPSDPSVETVTFVENPASPSTTTVTLVNSPSKTTTANSTVETVTFVENPAIPSTAATTLEGSLSNSTMQTVTFVENPVSPSTATVTLANSLSEPSPTTSLGTNLSNTTAETVTFVENPASSSAVTVTLSSSSSKPSTSDSTAETVTSTENPPKPSSTALVVSPKSSSSPSTQTATSVVSPAKPDIETVTFVPNSPNATIATSSAPRPAITAPPQVGTISPSMDHFTTITQTVSSGGDVNGDVNIEITIINIFTGEVTCKKQGSDEPCDSKPSPCLTTDIFTSTATAFNTVVVTVSPGMWTNGTSATGVAPPLGTGTGSPMLRRGRVPLIRKRL